jgi:hypothetical protein
MRFSDFLECKRKEAPGLILGDYTLEVISDQAFEDRMEGRRAECYIIQYLGMKVDNKWD